MCVYSYKCCHLHYQVIATCVCLQIHVLSLSLPSHSYLCVFTVTCVVAFISQVIATCVCLQLHVLSPSLVESLLRVCLQLHVLSPSLVESLLLVCVYSYMCCHLH